MKVVRIAAVAIMIGFLNAPLFAGDAPALKSDKEKEAYAVGVDLARNLRRQGIDINAAAMAKGMLDELSGSQLMMSETELRTALTSFQTDVKQKRARLVNLVAAENKKAADSFLAANKTKEGVITLPSGLQYKVIKQGEGIKPAATDTVEVHYRGTLLDGTEFDSSFSRGKPGTFKVNIVIAGWREALQLMPAGSKWQIFVPPQLAYGETGNGRNIGPNAALIFEVELIAVNKSIS